MWKHHGAHAQAADIQRRAAGSTGCGNVRTTTPDGHGDGGGGGGGDGEREWLCDRYPAGIDSEWLHPKALEVYDKSPDVFETAAAFVEAGDWIVWQLTNNGRRRHRHAITTIQDSIRR